MSSRSSKRAKRGLQERQAQHDSIRNEATKAAMKRPGSLNPNKSGGVRKKGGRKR